MRFLGFAAFLTFPLCAAPADPAADLSKQIAELTAIVQKLQQRVDELERKSTPAQTAAATPPAETKIDTASASASDPLRGTTVNMLVDGYYGYNTNNPIGRVNRLRAYDVSSNAFSLNQADLVVENAPDPEHGKRFGARIDLQFGQATETLQGNAANELRPGVWRNVFQAYGTFVAPVGSGLTIDFGKWASSLGIENNYSQDQINYSRSYLFNFLPYYHMGVRMTYQVSKLLGVSYWAVNGTQQVEPFNNFKDQYFGIALQPTKNLSWNVNYYLGQEHPNVEYLPGSTDPTLPTQQGTPFLPLPNAPKGKLHILDTYATWQVSPKWTLAGEADYVISRDMVTSAPAIAAGGAGYARYQISPRWAVGTRFEYLSDRGGLFSGTSQALKEGTITLEQKLLQGFLLREEWRTDFSNRPYFYTNTLGVLSREQSTATVGVVWWFGAKKSPW
jgi:hypothetical protein